MNCQDTQQLIQPYADGELDLVNTLNVEMHMQECGDCEARHRNLVTLRGSVRDASLYYRAPSALEAKIRAQVNRARSAENLGKSTVRPRTTERRLWIGPWLAAAAAALVLATTLWITMRQPGVRSEQLLASEITASHLRSLQADHLLDVVSTDQHTVKPWFDGKIDFAPPVRDFKTDGFALAGGRLDYINDRPIAALVYRHEKHVINLFIWPATGAPDAPEAVTSRQGYFLPHWSQSGMNFWAVSDMSEDGLRQFTNLVRNSGPPATQAAH